MFLYLLNFYNEMANNDVIILNSVLEQKRKQIAQEMSEDEFFENFVFDQAMKEFDLSDEELQSGNTDGTNDGGVDGFFMFINGDLIADETDVSSRYKKNPTIDLYIIQAKRSPGFSETTFDKLLTTIQDLFDLTKDLTKLQSFYRSALLDKVALFQKYYVELAGRHPKLVIHYIYGCKGETSLINDPLQNRKNLLIDATKEKFAGVEVTINLLGARELLDLSRVERTYTLQLNYIENTLSTGSNNYVVLAGIEDYYNFVSDERGILRKYIFDANVRDFQGYVEVNKDIMNTLLYEDSIDFWWLNNGVTILASKASISGKTITLDNVQIVNGLQTTTCINHYYNSIKEKNGQARDYDKNRSILVKIMVIDDEEAQNKIIKATNFQTSIPPASLKATDSIHRDIEDYFKLQDWYYDRRKNYYKNIGKPKARIISIPFLAQCLITITQREPDVARARPASLVKSEQAYSKIYGKSISPAMYLCIGKIGRMIELALKAESSEYSLPEKGNLKFHIMMVAVMKYLGKTDYTYEDLLKIDPSDIRGDQIDFAITEVIKHSRNHKIFSSSSLEQLAKSKSFVDYLITNLELSNGTIG